MAEKRAYFAEKLLSWWRGSGRSFPWRGKLTPFQLLLTIILLRQTYAERVEKFFEEIIRRIDAPRKLREIDRRELEELLKPLGLYRVKAKQLKELADALISRYGGEIPLELESLKKLPGIGEYTARALLSIYLNADYAVLDTNVERILRRFFGLKEARREELLALAEQLLPRGEARDFNLALIDFGALVCTARKPRCKECPLSEMCAARSVH